MYENALIFNSIFKWCFFFFCIISFIFIPFICFSFCSFGKRNGGSVRRPSECFVIESSEMIVVSVKIFKFTYILIKCSYKSPVYLLIYVDQSILSMKMV